MIWLGRLCSSNDLCTTKASNTHSTFNIRWLLIWTLSFWNLFCCILFLIFVHRLGKLLSNRNPTSVNIFYLHFHLFRSPPFQQISPPVSSYNEDCIRQVIWICRVPWRSNGLRLSCFNSSPPSAAYMRQWNVSALFPVMACVCSAPSHELNQCWRIVNLTPWKEQTTMKF